MLVDGRNGWILRLTDSNFIEITDEYFPGNDLGTKAPTSVTYNDTYFIVNIPNTNQYYYSWSYYAYQANNQDNDRASTQKRYSVSQGYATTYSDRQTE